MKDGVKSGKALVFKFVESCEERGKGAKEIIDPPVGPFAILVAINSKLLHVLT